MAEAEPQYLYLTTTGWKSGRPHEIEIWFTALDGRWYLLAEHGDRAHWVQNLRHSAKVQVRVGGHSSHARAEVLDEAAQPGLGQRVRSRSQEKYGWGGGLIVAIEPLPDETAD